MPVVAVTVVSRKIALLALSSLAGLLAVSGTSHALGEKARAEMKSRDGRDLGRVKLTETTSGVLLRLRLKGLPAGSHGFHIHENGKCEGDFESAGAIFNPLGAKHGYLNDEGPMVGDLPNLFVQSNGEIEVDFLSPFATLTKDAEDTLIDANGAALVIFEKADDYTADPEGNSGGRIACGVIVATK
ncbi:MAG: superoxide dismutase family protein [Hyphomicrobiaceae bacterium]